VVVCLVVAHLTVQTLRFATGNDRLYGLVYVFSLGAEYNFQAYYASFSLLFTAVLLTAIGFISRRDPKISPWFWFGLAAMFLFVSMDELMGFHERLITPIRSRFGTSGLLYYAWVIPYGLAIMVVGAIYVRFLLRLPRRSAVLFVLAGGMFVTGAIGMEMVGGWYSEQHGNANVTYVAMQTVEEVLEMAGVLLFIYALAEYADRHMGGLHVHVCSESRAGAAAEVDSGSSGPADGIAIGKGPASSPSELSQNPS
jgi:hypothetical protein